MKALSEQDWNFDNVPDNELVACCYWEYARESAFIRDLRKRSVECWKPLYTKCDGLSRPEEQRLHQDLQKAQSIGYASEVFIRGISCPPDGVFPDGPPLKPGEVHRTTGSFPKPWQSLTATERGYRSHIGTDVERIPLVPFKRGIALDARDISEFTKSQAARAEVAREQVRRKNPNLNEETLLRLGKLEFPEIKPSLYWAGGGEVTVVSIDWGAFTNDEIVNYFRQWVKANRPSQYPVPSRQGHKPKDWRTNLTRLAVMRLLSRFSAMQLLADDSFPEIWKTKQFSGRKWGDVTKWHDARREARQVFQKLFPFLPKTDLPLSWKRFAPAK
ncbi:MAG TPA: hypothetical protein VK742_06910 [Candidatus Sulfotelmatobacter sp.]|jgi:hypothetical protein|nr:hypothetical protein [Candidatus Sulfotelmatobacter sp.]